MLPVWPPARPLGVSPVQQRSFLRPLLPRESAVTVGTHHHDFPHNHARLSTSSVGESALSAWRQTLAADPRVAPADVWKVAQWLALRDSASCFLWAHGADAEHHLLPRIPAPGTADNSSHASGLVNEQELAVLAVRDDSDGNDTDAPLELVVRGYGDAAKLAARMLGHIREWEERQRPTALPRRIRVYSRHSASRPRHEEAIERTSSVIIVDWD